MAILNHKPHSKNLSNIKKVVAIFEDVGALRIDEEKVGGRFVKKPIVDYGRVEFDLKAA